MHEFIEVVQAAELAGLGVYSRAVLARAVTDDPAVVSVRVSVALEAHGYTSCDIEFIDKGGNAVGGMGL